MVVVLSSDFIPSRTNESTHQGYIVRVGHWQFVTVFGSRFD